MQVTRLAIPDVVLLRPKRHGDARGYFVESFNDRAFRHEVCNATFVQDNEALSAQAGTVRGLHFQRHPAAQGKLVRALKGAIFDVAVDIRRGSPSFGRHVSALLSAETGDQIWVPPGFAHGYCTVEPDSMIFYKDPALGIAWPVAPGTALLSDKDTRQPKLADLPTIFTYEGRP